jgi:hypothetical protein
MKGHTVTRMQNHARRWLLPAAMIALCAGGEALAQGGSPAIGGYPTPIPHNEQGRVLTAVRKPGMPAMRLRVADPIVCYANCDGSTVAPILNVADFACFLNAFAAGDPAANCDESTVPPVLNVADFACFLNRFSAGCS